MENKVETELCKGKNMLWCEAADHSAAPNKCRGACNDNENQDEDPQTTDIEKLEILGRRRRQSP